MGIKSRRNFLSTSCKLMVGATALGTATAHASETHSQMPAGSGNDLTVDTTATNKCATCQFWGGMRKISEDKKQVITQSMGWCNNPKSPNHRKLTMADHHMKKLGVWKKWAAL